MSSTYFFKGKVSEATKYFFSVDKRCQEVSLAGRIFYISTTVGQVVCWNKLCDLRFWELYLVEKTVLLAQRWGKAKCAVVSDCSPKAWWKLTNAISNFPTGGKVSSCAFPCNALQRVRRNVWEICRTFVPPPEKKCRRKHGIHHAFCLAARHTSPKTLPEKRTFPTQFSSH